MEPIFAVVLANDPSRITAAAAAQRMEDDLFVAELPHMLYRGDTSVRGCLSRGAEKFLR